jgi:hypothetical protein
MFGHGRCRRGRRGRGRNGGYIVQGTIRVAVGGKVAVSREVGRHVENCIAKRQGLRQGAAVDEYCYRR